MDVTLLENSEVIRHFLDLFYYDLASQSPSGEKICIENNNYYFDGPVLSEYVMQQDSLGNFYVCTQDHEVVGFAMVDLIGYDINLFNMIEVLWVPKYLRHKVSQSKLFKRFFIVCTTIMQTGWFELIQGCQRLLHSGARWEKNTLGLLMTLWPGGG